MRKANGPNLCGDSCTDRAALWKVLCALPVISPLCEAEKNQAAAYVVVVQQLICQLAGMSSPFPFQHILHEFL